MLLLPDRRGGDLGDEGGFGEETALLFLDLTANVNLDGHLGSVL